MYRDAYEGAYCRWGVYGGQFSSSAGRDQGGAGKVFTDRTYKLGIVLSMTIPLIRLNLSASLLSVFLLYVTVRVRTPAVATKTTFNTGL